MTETLEAIQSKPIETETIARLKERRNNRRQFVKVPWDWVTALASARRVPTFKLALFLLHEFWRNPDQPVVVSNTRAAEFGLTRKTKAIALSELVSWGLVRVEQTGRQSPRAYRVV